MSTPKTPDPAAALDAVRVLMGDALDKLTPARALDNLEALVRTARGDTSNILLLLGSVARLRQAITPGDAAKPTD